MTKKNKEIRAMFAHPVYDEKEIAAVVKTLRNKTLLPGKDVAALEKKIASLFGKKHGIVVNSGSSANLLAIEILDLPAGSEVITPILTFGTVLAPLVQKNLVPVFVDVEMGTYLPNIDQIEKAITKKTKAILIPSLLGNIPDWERLAKIAKKHKLFLIDDSCDTLGGTYKGKPTGHYTDITTTSLYGAHIVTGAGSGGAICVNKKNWFDRLQILRGWGRRVSNETNTKKRYSEKLLGVPYDSKFIYEEAGYNFQLAEPSASFALEQLKRLPAFTKIRSHNVKELRMFFEKYSEYFYLPEETHGAANNNWLAFALTIREDAPFSRLQLIEHLEKHDIQILTLFSGNITLHPWMKKVSYKTPFKKYPVTDATTTHGFIIPCHQGIGEKELTHIKAVSEQFLSKYKD